MKKTYQRPWVKSIHMEPSYPLAFSPAAQGGIGTGNNGGDYTPGSGTKDEHGDIGYGGGSSEDDEVGAKVGWGVQGWD